MKFLTELHPTIFLNKIQIFLWNKLERVRNYHDFFILKFLPKSHPGYQSLPGINPVICSKQGIAGPHEDIGGATRRYQGNIGPTESLMAWLGSLLQNLILPKKKYRKKPCNYGCWEFWAKALVDCDFSEENFLFNKKSTWILKRRKQTWKNKFDKQTLQLEKYNFFNKKKQLY